MRIKVNEIRIGNYVNHKYSESDYAAITGISEEGDVFIDEITWDYLTIEDIEPLTLTEEWLIRFGFNGQPSDYGKDKLSVCLKGSDKFHIEGRVYYKDWAIIESQPKYVHELQNLYFALTNQELEFLKP